MRRSAIRRLTALVLSWIVPATSVWSTAPVAAAESRPAPAVPLYRPRPAAEAVLSTLGERVHGPAANPEPVAAAPVDPSLPSFGILVGQILSDATGLPVPSATVRLAGSADPAQPVNLEGRYAFPAGVGAVLLLAEAPGFTSVERRATAVAGQGTAVLDARPTPLAAPVNVGPSGGPVSAGAVTVTVPSGAVSADTGFVLTPLSGQGLPGRLPLGFAPVQAFDLRAGGSVSGALTVRLTGLPSTGELHLVEYRPGPHAWHVTATSLAVSSGEATSSLPGLGAYAVVIADGGGPTVPGPGAPLVGSAPVAAPPGLSGAATVEPIQVPSTGATARGHLTASSPTALPSGTVLQARLTESFTVGGASIQDEPRVQDVIAYRAQPASGLSLKATLPLTAVRTFSAADLAEGRLHLEFWTGRPDLAGSVGGGTEAVTVESGPARLTVPAGSLDHDTSVSILSVPLSSFLPGAPGVTALGEVVVDLSGALLSQGAELSLAAGAGAGETLLIARVERVGGVPYLTVVSLAEAQGGRVVSADYPGLPGIVRGGRYVFYRVNGPVGFVAGSTTSQAGPVSAVVGTAGLPFVGISSTGGSYITAARPGAAVEVTATVPGTPHRATATVAVQAGQTASLDLSLTAGLTTVEVLPADGATGVAVSVAVQVTASQALDEPTVSATSVRLIKGNPDTGPALPAARVLSADGRTLSVVPDAPLDPATVYALRVTGLKDVFGGPVNVPDTHFTTRADVTPEYDLSKVTFSFPNEAGLVHVSALAGSFPPTARVMIVNERNGIVLTLMVDNQGRLDGELPATLDDTLAVTLEDPQGNVVSGRQSRFVDLATGRMAVGSTGGVVAGTGGVELRLPEGAVDRGVIFKASAVNPTSVPAEQRPSLGDAVLASALSIEAPSSPTFRKEVDVAFPKPAGAPPGAFFYVVRKVQGPDGQVFFQTIDTASVEGDKVVTNSPPFSGYVESIGAFAFTGVGAVAVGGTAATMMFLMWSFDSQLPQRAQMGVISGRVTRSQWNPTLRRWEYAPVAGAILRRLVNGVDPFTSGGGGKTFARSREDGTYSFFDAQYTGGAAVVKATDPLTGQEREASGYGIDPLDRPVWAQPYRAMATANIAFTPTAQPRPEVDVRVLERQGGAWVFSDGLVTQGQPVVIGFVVTNAVLESATLDGVPLALRDGEPEHLGMEKVADHVPGATGAVTVVATARPVAGNPVTVTASFLVIAEGDDNNRVLQGVAPQVILPRLVPQPGATSVSPATFLEVAFTEPVTNLPGGVALHELLPGGALGPVQPIQLIGAGPQGPVPTVTESSQVSRLTIRPTGGLKYQTSYRLVLSAAIHDLDTGEGGDPKELAPFSADFETFRTGVVGGSEARYHSAGIVTLEDRAWLVENHFSGGWVQTFDVSDPVEPRPVGGVFSFAGRPVDLAGETNSTAIPGVRRLLVVGTTVTERSRPSNVHVFDVTTDTPRRIGAASVARNSVDGTLARLEVKGDFAYAITWHKGVQVIDLARAKANYDLEVQQLGSTWRIDQLLGQDGAGFGHDAVTQTIPVRKPPAPAQPPELAQHWLMTDLKVGDYVYEGMSQPLVFVTGELCFAVINPQTGSAGSPMAVQAGPNRLLFGYALALGRIDNKDVAVVVGSGQANHPATGESTTGPVLAVLDLSAILEPSAAPKVLSVVPLFGGTFQLATSPTDVVLRDELAIVAGERNAIVVDLSSLAQPQVVGAIEGIGGHLSLSRDGLVFSTARSVWGGSSELGGVRTAAMGPVTIVMPKPVMVAYDRRSIEAQLVKYRAIPKPERIQSSQLEIVRDGAVLQTIPAPLDETTGKGSLPLPTGTLHPADPGLRARLIVNRGRPDRPIPLEKELPAHSFKLLPDEVVTVRADDWARDEELLFVTATNQALLDHLGEADLQPPYAPPTLSWSLYGSSGGFLMWPEETPATGLYDSEYQPAVTVPALQYAELRMGSVLLGRSGTIEVVPGRADRAQIYAAPPPYSPTGLGNELPADGKTEVDVVIQDIRDTFGNLVVQGTVTWFVVEDDTGEILLQETPIVSGRSSTRYRAGIEPKPVTISAEIEEKEFSVVVQQRPLTITLVQEANVIRATVTSAAGRPADFTPIYFGCALRGAVIGQIVLEGGTATAQYIQEVNPRRSVPRYVPLFASVGRARALLQYDLRQGPGIRVDTDAEWLVGNAPGVPAEDPVVHAQTVARITGGEPGATVPLVLGSLRDPIVQPIAAFPLDELVDPGGARTTNSSYGEIAAQVDPGVEVDYTTVGVGGASFRFPGSAGLTLPATPALDLRAEFGVAGEVFFDSVSAASKLIDRAGAWGLGLVLEGGEPRLEFYVMSGGVRKRVLSPQALAAATWYHFSAQHQGGRLLITLNEGGSVQIGDAAGPADVVATPIRVGSDFAGNLDQIEIFDLTRPPVALFANDSTTIDVLLDENGEASLPIHSTNVFYDVAPGAAPNGPRNVVLRISRAPEADTQEQSPATIVAMETGRSFGECLDGVATGESETGTGIACDIFVGLLPGAGEGQAVRDLTVAGKHLIEGKRTTADYIKAGVALAMVVAALFPATRALLRSSGEARLALAGTRAELVLVRKELQIIGGESGVAEQKLLQLFTEGANVEAREALLQIYRRFGNDITNGTKTWERLERLAQVMDRDELLISLGRVASDARFSARSIEQLIEGLERLPLPAGFRLSPDAIEGMALFCLRAPRKPVARLGRMWAEIRGAGTLTENEQRTVLDNMFTWIKQGEAVQPPGWQGFVAKGPGTLPGVSTRGFYHQLEDMASMGFRDIYKVDQALPGAYKGRPDLILKRATDGKLIQIEYKNLGLNRLLGKHDRSQLAANIKAAMNRAQVGGGQLDPRRVEEELRRITYRIRGPEAGYPQLREQVQKIMEDSLTTPLKHLAATVTAPGAGSFVEFLGKGVPF